MAKKKEPSALVLRYLESLNNPQPQPQKNLDRRSPQHRRVQDNNSVEWWNSHEVQESQRQLATEFIKTIPNYTNGLLKRCGIVITGGGKYFVSAYITIRVIRMLGCVLPIELWHLDGEMDEQMVDIVTPLGVTCHNASDHAKGSGYFIDHWWKGWQLKAYALLHSSFAEVLMLDADSYPVRDPSFLFDWSGYCEHGAIFWPDVGQSRRMFPHGAAKSLGVPSFTETPTESGQLVVNKVQCWRECNLAKHYNAQANYTYHIVYGDKDTFPTAWHRLGSKYARMWEVSKFIKPGIIQLDHNGETLFQHRIHDKFRLPGTKFDSTNQNTTVNTVANWQHEDFCHYILKELSQRWSD